MRSHHEAPPRQEEREEAEEQGEEAEVDAARQRPGVAGEELQERGCQQAAGAGEEEGEGGGAGEALLPPQPTMETGAKAAALENGR